MAVVLGRRTGVAVVLAGAEMGGAERQALLLAQHLRDRVGCPVEVWNLSGRADGLAARECRRLGLRCHSLRVRLLGTRRRVLGELAGFAWALRRTRPTVLLPYCRVPNLACGVVWRWSGARLYVWNQRNEGHDLNGRRLERLTARKAAWLVANSRAGAELLVSELGADPGRVRIVHNGVALAPPELSREAWRARLQVADDQFVACMVANLRRHKDHATLLRAWRLVHDARPWLPRPPVLVLAGKEMDAADQVRATVADLGLGAAVRVTGQVRDISGLLKAVDLSVFSSPSEGLPNGVIEPMAAGLPFAGSDIAAIREAVGVEQSDLLAPPGDAPALAERILRLLRDPALRLARGRANRARARREFDPERMCRETVELLDEALRRRPGGRGA